MNNLPNQVQLEIKIKSGNDAIASNPDLSVGEILIGVACDIRIGKRGGRLRDTNGNHVGDWWMEAESSLELINT